MISTGLAAFGPAEDRRDKVPDNPMPTAGSCSRHATMARSAVGRAPADSAQVAARWPVAGTPLGIPLLCFGLDRRNLFTFAGAGQASSDCYQRREQELRMRGRERMLTLSRATALDAIGNSDQMRLEH